MAVEIRFTHSPRAKARQRPLLDKTVKGKTLDQIAGPLVTYSVPVLVCKVEVVVFTLKGNVEYDVR